MKLPLVAAKLVEMKGLKSLKLHIVDDGDEDWGTKLTRRPEKGGKRNGRMGRREGQAAEAMLKAEKKVLRELVVGLKGLRVFELRGFVDGEFAEGLEEWVRLGRKG